MPKLVNKNPYPVRFGPDRNDMGVSQSRQRLSPGQVVEVSGELADELKSIDGVETARKGDEKNYAEHLARLDGATGGVSIDAERSRFIESLNAEKAQATVIAPLQKVIGDDAAPLGPPTGTVTTTQAVSRETEGPSELAPFGHLAADPDKEGKDDASEIEQKQRAAQAAAEQAAETYVLGEGVEAPEDEPDDEPEEDDEPGSEPENQE